MLFSILPCTAVPVAASSILGSGETFYGVLVTIIVLCVVMNQNNFILNVLDEIKHKLIDLIASEHDDKEKKDRKTRIDKIENQLNKHRLGFDLLHALINPPTDEQKSYLQAYSKLQEVQQIIKIEDLQSTKYEEYQKKKNSGIGITRDEKVEYLKGYLGEDRIRHMHFIEDTDEQTAAPFYMFFFCLVVFSTDHILIPLGNFWWSPFENFGILFLYLFSIFSICFWWLKWVFWRQRTSIRKYIHATKKGELFSKKKKRKWLIAGSILLGTVALASLAHLYWNRYVCWSILGGALILLLIVKRCKCLDSKQENYDKMFILTHLLYLFVASLVIALPVYLLSRSDAPYSDGPLRLIILTFTLINGILIPFIFPYYKYRKLSKKCYYHSKDMIEEWKNKTDEIIQNLEDAYKHKNNK